MKRNLMRKGAAFFGAMILAAVPCMAQEGGLSLFDGLGQESNNIMTPQGMLASGGDTIALDELGISVVVDDYASIREDDGFVYIYTMYDESMPYVIVGYYDMVADDFADAFTDYMREGYPDLRVTQEATPLTIAGKDFTKIGYEYTASGYTIQDTRLFTEMGGKTYMFGAKEVPALAYLVGDGFLEQVAGSAAMLAGGAIDYSGHVENGTSVEGSGPSVADLGGLGNEPSSQVETEGGTVEDTGSVAGGASTSGTITFDESVAKYEGVWVEFEDGFKLYLPSDWNTYVISDEQRQAGVLYQAGATSGATQTPAQIAVNDGESGGLTSIEEIAQNLSMVGYTVEDLITINGIDCVAYSYDAQDLTGVMFFCPNNPNYMFAVVGYNYSQNVDTIACILCSLSLDQ